MATKRERTAKKAPVTKRAAASKRATAAKRKQQNKVVESPLDDHYTVVPRMVSIMLCSKVEEYVKDFARKCEDVVSLGEEIYKNGLFHDDEPRTNKVLSVKLMLAAEYSRCRKAIVVQPVAIPLMMYKMLKMTEANDGVKHSEYGMGDPFQKDIVGMHIAIVGGGNGTDTVEDNETRLLRMNPSVGNMLMAMKNRDVWPDGWVVVTKKRGKEVREPLRDFLDAAMNENARGCMKMRDAVVSPEEAR